MQASFSQRKSLLITAGVERNGVPMVLPLAAMKRLIARAGGERVSDSAAQALTEILEEKAETVSQKAVLLARHAGRKTITGDDIKLANK